MVQKLALKIKESLPKHMIDNKLTKEFFPLAYKNVYKGNKWKKKKLYLHEIIYIIIGRNLRKFWKKKKILLQLDWSWTEHIN